MLAFIENFLSNRICKVAANGKYSHSFIPENGVPQGSVLSTTLFILALNDLPHTVQSPVKYALYADDIILYCAGKITTTTSKLLQNCINKLSQWSKATGFNFCASKCKVIKFTRKKNTSVPLIKLNNIPLEVVQRHKFLGITFDSRLTWHQHIQNVKQNCAGRINILKALSHQHWGAEEGALLRIYRSLIRSKLDYGSIVFSTASKSNLKILDAVHNTSLRLCLGAYRSSPAESLYCESNELPLYLRRQQLLLSYSARVSATPRNPVYEILTSNHHVPSTPTRLPSIRQILNPLLLSYNLSSTRPFALPAVPPWTKVIPTINTTLCKYDKHSTPHETIRQAYLELIHKHQLQNILYTDASRSESGTGCAVATSHTVVSSCRISSHSTIHTGELYGILLALRSIAGSNLRATVCSDSLSAINSVKNIYSTNALVDEIHETCHLLASRNISITLLWVPSHTGIAGNEKADQAAKDILSTESLVQSIQLQQDIKHAMKADILQKWQQVWSRSHNKLSRIQPQIVKNNLPQMHRRDTVVLRRLRIGHTRLTHGYLMVNEDPPVCIACDTQMTVVHLLAECPLYTDDRQQCNLTTDLQRDLSLVNPGSILKFLSNTNMFNHI